MSGIRFEKPQRAAGGGDTIPAGIYVLWPSSGAVPDGWALADGTNGTVDWRGYYPRGTPSGDTVNRTYSSATHTHSASHTHDFTGTGHTHTQPTHTHDGPCHTHTLSAHTHCVSDHCHAVNAHSHCVTPDPHDHGSGDMCTPTLAHCACTCNFVTCAAGTSAVTCVYDHAPDNITGCTSTKALSTDTSSPGTSSDGGGDTGAPSTDETGDGGDSATSAAGDDNTGCTVAGGTVDSCSLTTASGSSLPPTRNTDFIMKL